MGSVLALVWVAHGPGVHGYFIGDDFVHLERVLREPWNLLANDDAFGYFRPLTKLLFAVDHRVAGLDPRWYHVTNVAIHAVNALLVGAVARAVLGGAGFASALAAVLFATHPAHAVTVSWISARADLLAAGWTLVAVLALFQLRGGGSSGSRLCLATAVVLAVAAKESGVAVPLLLLTLDRLVVFDAVGRPPTWRRSLATSAGLLSLVVAFLVLRAWVLGDPIGGYGTRRLAASPWIVYEVILSAGRVLAPVHVTSLGAVSRAGLAAAILTLEGLALAAVVRGDAVRRRAVIGGAAWFAVAILPVTSLLAFRWGGGGERYLYLPTVGVILALVTLVTRGGPAGFLGQRARVALAAIVVMLLGAGTRRESVAWAAVTGAAPDIQSAILADPAVREGDVVLIFNSDENLHSGPPFDVMLQTQLEGALAPPYFPLAIRANPYRWPAPPTQLHAFLWQEGERRLIRVHVPPPLGAAAPLPVWDELRGWVAHDLRRRDGEWEVSGARPALVSPSVVVRTLDVLSVEVTVRTSECARWSPCDAWTRLVYTWRPGRWRLAWTAADGQWHDERFVEFFVSAAPGLHRVPIDVVHDVRWFATGSIERLAVLPPSGVRVFTLAGVRLVSRHESTARFP